MLALSTAAPRGGGRDTAFPLAKSTPPTPSLLNAFPCFRARSPVDDSAPCPKRPNPHAPLGSPAVGQRAEGVPAGFKNKSDTQLGSGGLPLERSSRGSPGRDRADLLLSGLQKSAPRTGPLSAHLRDGAAAGAQNSLALRRHQ